MGDWHDESVGRTAVHVWIERIGRAKRVRRSGRRRARASILVSGCVRGGMEGETLDVLR